MNRSVQFLIGIMAIAIAIGAGFYGRNLYLKEVSTYQVPVPIIPIPAYTVLEADMFQMLEMPRTLESLPYYASIRDLAGKISTVALPAEIPVPQANAVPVDQFRLASPAFEVLSIPVKPVSAVGGQIRIGDRVNIYQARSVLADSQGVSPSVEQRSQIQVELIAASVLVVDVRNDQGDAADPSTSHSDGSTFDSSQNEQVQILTLAVDPSTVEGILVAVATSQEQGGLLWTTLALP